MQQEQEGADFSDEPELFYPPFYYRGTVTTSSIVVELIGSSAPPLLPLQSKQEHDDQQCDDQIAYHSLLATLPFPNIRYPH